MICTYKSCTSGAEHSHLDKNDREWANLCTVHHDELEQVMDALNVKKLVGVWARAGHKHPSRKKAGEGKMMSPQAGRTTAQHVAAGEVRCLACAKWFKPGGLCNQRCRHCMSEFFKRAYANQWINPIVNPAWPGLIQEKAPAHMPHA